MGTILKLGLGAVVFTAQGVKVFLDAAGGKTPDMRIDGPEASGPNLETHVHFGDGPGESVSGGALDFLLGVAYCGPKEASTKNKDYILADQNSLENIRKYSGIEKRVSDAYRG